MSLTSYFMFDVEDFGSISHCSPADNRHMLPVASHQLPTPSGAVPAMSGGHMGTQHSAIHSQIPVYPNSAGTSHPYVGVYPSVLQPEIVASKSMSMIYAPHQTPLTFNTYYKDLSSSTTSIPTNSAASYESVENFDFRTSCTPGQVVQCPATSTTNGAERRKSTKPKSDGVVAKRNARERRRVQAVNGAFSKLRKHIPYENRNKRLSKVKTLKIAIDYIHCLQDLLYRVDFEDFRQSTVKGNSIADQSNA